MNCRLERRDTFLLIIILVYSILVSTYADAIQDARVTVADNGVGVCMGADSPDNVVCANQTFLLEGTQDHIIYLTPGSYQASNSSYVKKFDDYVMQPLGIFFVIIFPIIGVLILFMVLRIAWRVI